MKVPQITIYFWVIKVCCTTVGETLADFLTNNVNWHLPGSFNTSSFNATNSTDNGSEDTTNPLNEAVTVGVFAGILIIILITQFSVKRYYAVVYWLAVVFMSIEGTLVTDNLTDNVGVELWKTTLIFASALSVTFGTWFWFERTLDIHSVFTVRREAWYLLAILFTFALGTSFGDLISEYLSEATLAVSGFAAAALVFAGWIAAIAGMWAVGLMPPVPAFWCAYVMTRPLGASLGDLLSQDRDVGGLGLGTSTTSLILMAIIVTATLYLACSGIDIIPHEQAEPGGCGASDQSTPPSPRAESVPEVSVSFESMADGRAAAWTDCAGMPPPLGFPGLLSATRSSAVTAASPVGVAVRTGVHGGDDSDKKVGSAAVPPSGHRAQPHLPACAHELLRRLPAVKRI